MTAHCSINVLTALLFICQAPEETASPVSEELVKEEEEVKEEEKEEEKKEEKEEEGVVNADKESEVGTVI